MAQQWVRADLDEVGVLFCGRGDRLAVESLYVEDVEDDGDDAPAA